MTQTAAIVLAAGTGERYGAAKQFEELTAGVRLVDAAVEMAKMVASDVVVVLPAGVVWDGTPVFSAVAGGQTRLDSVGAGLSALSNSVEYVLIHDAAHPLATVETAMSVLTAVRAGADAALPLLPVVDVVKRFDQDRLVTVGRDGLSLAQVPMAFRVEALREAHASVNEGAVEPFWEDTQLIERMGGNISGIPGSSGNVHVVGERDLAVVRLLAGVIDPE